MDAQVLHELTPSSGRKAAVLSGRAKGGVRPQLREVSKVLSKQEQFLNDLL